MPADDPSESGFSLKRWSRRKLAAARAAGAPATATSVPAATATTPVAAEVPAIRPAPGPESATTVPALPPVGDLTFDSDFAAYLQPRVDKALRQQALKKLFRDPRFNVMDGLDVYIDDYSLPDPVPPELVKEMLHARNVLDPPKTRVGADGTIEEVPPVAAGAAPTPAVAPDTSTGNDRGDGTDVPTPSVGAVEGLR